MTTVEKLYQLIPTLTDAQLGEVLDFAEFLRYKKDAAEKKDSLISGKLTTLKGVAKRSGDPPSDEALKAEYTDYLDQKYK